MRNQYFFLIIAAIVVGIGFGFSGSNVDAAEDAMRFQGRLTDNQGYPIVGPQVRIKTALFNAPDGGLKVWEMGETVVATNDAGLFAMDIGPLDSAIFSTHAHLFLQVSVYDGSGYKELKPRQKLSRVPYSSQSYFADTASTASFAVTAADIANNAVSTAKLKDNAVTSDKIQDGTINLSKLNPQLQTMLIPPGLIAMFDGACPDGWSRFDKLDNRFPLGVPVYSGNPGGANRISGLTTDAIAPHAHQVRNHTHSSGSLYADTASFYKGGDGSNKVWVWGNWPGGLPVRGDTGGMNSTDMTTNAGGHQHTINSDGAWLPPYLGVVYCRKD